MKDEFTEPDSGIVGDVADPMTVSRADEPVEISLDERIGYDAQIVRVDPTDPRFDPVRTLAVVLLQLLEHNADWPRVLLRRLHEVTMSARSAYVTETFLRALAGLPIRGPEEIARSLGITKQAVSREVLDALARIQAESPEIAQLLATCREHYHAMPPPPPRERQLLALPRSLLGQRVTADINGRRLPVTLQARADREIDVVGAGAVLLATCRADALRLSVALREDGTLADDPFVVIPAGQATGCRAA